ncbi:hypothetical protein PROVRUST_04574 [Providencia rustigianii DSM 4541]|uniref:Uncharacterized protein n=1 Tax=Providencia rustigianii DSM 4541 TaxID=500637 RepID=D1NXE5_9GAMM|nr:hypothetical protein PROVRUST_04574 [Providencia rustigianii DSM 4541]
MVAVSAKINCYGKATSAPLLNGVEGENLRKLQGQVAQGVTNRVKEREE